MDTPIAVDWPDSENAESVDECVSGIYNVLNYAVKENIPLMRFENSIFPPWYTTGLKSYIFQIYFQKKKGQVFGKYGKPVRRNYVNCLKKPKELPYDMYFKQKMNSKNLDIAGLFSERFSEVFVPNSPPPTFNQFLSLESFWDLDFKHVDSFRHI